MQPSHVVVIDYSTNKKEMRGISVARAPSPAASVPEYVSRRRKSKRQKTADREKRKAENRKHWRHVHAVELNTTKRLLFKALRLLRRHKIELKPEMASVLSQHESRVAARVGRTRALRKKFEVSTT